MPWVPVAIAPAMALPVDVAEVGQREAELGELLVEHVEGCSGADRRLATRRVDRRDPGQAAESQLQAVGDGDTGEGVPRADRLDAQAATPGLADLLDDLVLGARRRDAGERRRLGARPVRPLDAADDLRRLVSAKALPFPTIGRGPPRRPRSPCDERQLGEALGQLARLGVPEPYPIAEREPVGRRALEGRLHLAGPLRAESAQALLASGLRHARPARRTGGDVAAGYTVTISSEGRRTTGQPKKAAGSERQPVVAVEERGGVEPGSGGELGQRRVEPGDVEAARATPVDELEVGQAPDGSDDLGAAGRGAGRRSGP